MWSGAELDDPCPSVRYRALEAFQISMKADSRRKNQEKNSHSIDPASHQGRQFKLLWSNIRHCVLRDSDPACRAKALDALMDLAPLGDVECVELAMVRDKVSERGLCLRCMLWSVSGFCEKQRDTAHARVNE